MLSSYNNLLSWSDGTRILDSLVCAICLVQSLHILTINKINSGNVVLTYSIIDDQNNNN